MIKGLPDRYIFVPPLRLGECGFLVKGRVVNNDTNTHQERIKIIYDSGIGDYLDLLSKENDEVRILEIGGGYGALAYWFKRAYEKVSYSIIDLPECLVFSRLYLYLNMPNVPSGFGPSVAAKYGFQFIPNYMAESLSGRFDLVINTLSMSEMSAHQVEKYVELIKTVWIHDEGIFFEQNQDNRHMGLLFAQQIFSAKFAHRLDLNQDGIVYRNGHPNIWSNRPISLKCRPHR
jgi:hypothetical protein